uniref:Uncharacterized protein n=1 Tax=Myotis myotis TaxID=51298 RepID=A0A7J7SBV2_MYOMY|nr:hypothetical protein mMyoMyo1_009453 [Myotis myotis]
MDAYVKGCLLLRGAGGMCPCVCLCVCAPSHPCVCRAFGCSVLSVYLQTSSFTLLSVAATDGNDERDRGVGRDTELTLNSRSAETWSSLIDVHGAGVRRYHHSEPLAGSVPTCQEEETDILTP